MFIQHISKTVKGVKYTYPCLCRSYREDGKIKKEIVKNLSGLPGFLVESLDQSLKANKGKGLDFMETRQGKSFGALYALLQIAKDIGVLKALGNTSKGKLALVQIFSRIIDQSSRNAIVNSFAKNHAIEDVVNPGAFTVHDLYDNLEWLESRQRTIEKKMFEFKYADKPPTNIFLYDVTSSYFEGDQNELAAFGYNRDKKSGKKQIVIGLLCDHDGSPMSIEVFEGNTGDTATVLSQIKKLKDDFNVQNVTFVGDKGMIKSTQIEDLNEENFHYITTITRGQIRTLLNRGAIQLEFFENELFEVSEGDTRYILRKNPYRAEEVKKNREERMGKFESFILLQNEKLNEKPKSRVETSTKLIAKKMESLKLGKYYHLSINEEQRSIGFERIEKAIEEDAELDGCYVVKTDLDIKDAPTQYVHDQYKGLAKVEYSFRTIKTTQLEVRPIYLVKENRTKGHVFVCMLALKIIRELENRLKNNSIDVTTKHAISVLNQVQYISYVYQNKTIKKTPDKLTEEQNQILKALGITLPRKV